MAMTTIWSAACRHRKLAAALLILVCIINKFTFSSTASKLSLLPYNAPATIQSKSSATTGFPSDMFAAEALPSTNSDAAKPSDFDCKPKIYVYPAPSDMQVNKKASRMYFQLETELISGLQQRGRVVDDPTEADIFWVPHALVAHWIIRDGGGDQDRMKEYYNLQLRPFLQHIYYDLPYFNASNGRDHVFVYTMDMGPICELDHGSPVFSYDDIWHKVIHPMIQIGYSGQRGLRPTIETASVHRPECWDDERDIAVPQYHKWDMRKSVEAANCLFEKDNCQPWADLLLERAARIKAGFFFKGQTIAGKFCSVGIRQWVATFCKTTSWCQNATEMKDAVFGLCPAGWACWSSRLYDAFDKGTIPILLADDMVIPFERWLDYDELIFQITTGSPVQLASDGGVDFSELHSLAQSWIQACNTDASTETCVSHRVSEMMANIATSRQWFGWNPDGDENAFAMVEKELMARVKPAVCSPPVKT